MVDMCRAFVAVDFDSSVTREVVKLQEILKNWKFTGKMTELENLHLTLKFLGKVDREKLESVREKLNEIKFQKFEAILEKTGIFSFKGKPRIVWIKISGKEIYELQEKVDLALEDLSFKKEKRFMSHMTIARVKYVKDKKGFKEYVGGIGLKDVKFRVEGFKLKESELTSLGPIYKDLKIYYF